MGAIGTEMGGGTAWSCFSKAVLTEAKKDTLKVFQGGGGGGMRAGLMPIQSFLLNVVGREGGIFQPAENWC